MIEMQGKELGERFLGKTSVVLSLIWKITLSIEELRFISMQTGNTDDPGEIGEKLNDAVNGTISECQIALHDIVKFHFRTTIWAGQKFGDYVGDSVQFKALIVAIYATPRGIKGFYPRRAQEIGNSGCLGA